MDFSNKLECLSLASLSSLIKCLWVRLGDPRVVHLKGASLVWALVLLAKIRLGWKGLPGTKTFAFHGNPKITPIISFMIQAPGVNLLKIS